MENTLLPFANPDPLDAFYLALDQALTQFLAQNPAVCTGCGECCHFKEAGHILYASSLERRRLSQSRPVENPDASAAQIASGERCPFQKNGACQARAGRVLGCRLHYCRLEGNPEAEAFAEEWHRKLKELHEKLDVEWDYRPAFPL